jgi:simple sugar transport system ATP-binding protein
MAIHERIVAMKKAGCAILLVSVELDEIMALADRIAVMNAGRIVGEVAREDADRAVLGRMMGGGEGDAAARPEPGATASGSEAAAARPATAARWPHAETSPETDAAAGGRR